jgi:hypothetical protein
MAFDLAELRAAAEAEGKQLIVFGRREGPGLKPAGHVLVEKGATDVEITNAVFEAKYGRPIDPREQMLQELVEARSAER